MLHVELHNEITGFIGEHESSDYCGTFSFE